MPAEVELEGVGFRPDYSLRDHLGADVPSVLSEAIEYGFDVAWVRGRFPCLFGFTPDPAEIEKSLLYSGFAAVTDNGAVCFPFVCTDHYGKTALGFSDDGPLEATKRSIANAFWDALLEHAEDLADFQARVYHIGAMVWLNYGCDAGRPYCEESQE
jgi:hypothetical protein